MKHLAFLAILFAQITVYGQRSENLIPHEATSVVSINNVNLLQKISLDELIQYRFMEELHHDFIDGSTSGWTLKDSGFDFDEKINIFNGKGKDYEVTGMTFGVIDQNQLFYIFDDFNKIDSPVSGVQMFASYFNRLAIRGDKAILFRITPSYQLITDITDSIWYSRGNGSHWDYDGYEFEEEYDEFEEFDVYEEGQDETEIETWDEEPLQEALETGKNYYELLDSVEATYHEEFLNTFITGLFIDGKNLVNSNPDFSAKLQASNSEGMYYVDNSANLNGSGDYSFMKNYYPNVFNRIEQIYTGNVLAGNIYIDDQTIKLDLTAKYGDELGQIYEELGSAKFDKKMLPYIHEDNIAYFTSNLDIKSAYDASFETMMSILNSSERPQMIAMAMGMDIMNEFLDKDAIFDAYKGGMFMTYGGVQKVKTKKIVFDYDEDTFEYSEREEEAEEDMPIFTWGFSTDRNDFADKMITYMSRIFHSERQFNNQEIINRGEYWEITNGILESVSMYIINKNGVVIFTNDENLAKNNNNGFGSNAVPKKRMKKALKGGSLYAFADMNRAISELPNEMFDDEQNELLDVFRGKTGNVQLTSMKSGKNESKYEITYRFDSQEDSGTYILDLINSLYVIGK